MVAYGPRRRFYHVELTIDGKIIRGAYEKIGDNLLITTIDAQKNVPLDGGLEEDVARRILSELYAARVPAVPPTGSETRHERLG